MAPTSTAISSTLCTIHQRRQVTVLCLIFSMALAFTGAMRLVPMNVMAAPLLGALLFLIHGALDPSRQGFLHHRRTRVFGLALTLVAALTIGLIAPQGATPALLFASAIAYRHHRGGSRLHLAAAEELEDLRLKIIALESRHRVELQLRSLAYPGDDKISKAS